MTEIKNLLKSKCPAGSEQGALKASDEVYWHVGKNTNTWWLNTKGCDTREEKVIKSYDKTFH